ncbi:MAG: PEP-CTERM sorting domain-containing protein [Pseudomonadota bacterium]
MGLVQIFAAGSALMVTGIVSASAAPMTSVEVIGAEAPSDQSLGPDFFVTVSDSFSSDEFGAARADIGTVGTTAAGGYFSAASFTDEITASGAGGGTGVMQFVFDLDGTFFGGGAIDIDMTTSVSALDAALPGSLFGLDARSSPLPAAGSAAIASTFIGGTPAANEISYGLSGPTPSDIDLSITANTFDERVIDTQLVVYLAYQSGLAFDFTFGMSVFSTFGEIVDFVGTAELVAVDVVDPLTLQVMDDPTFEVSGQGGGDYIALAAANAGGDPIPVPGAIWLMGAGAALLGVRRKRS